MFKPLLRTLPTLSGNFTINCKLNEFNKERTNEYCTYVRSANLLPLQSSLFKKEIRVDLLSGKYEFDILKYYNDYSDFFYKDNFSYYKNNYKVLNLNALYNNTNDARNKDYEFGCKRISYSKYNYQFNFYAPIYIDNFKDLPEYFCIKVKFNNTIIKKIKIYIGKENTSNYLKYYLIKYIHQIDNKVMQCFPESGNTIYYGLNVNNATLSTVNDSLTYNIFKNQTTINNFDYTLCKGFERNNLIMTQIIPLSFSFNVNDILNNYEKEFFKGSELQISGEYYSKYDTEYEFYDFDINYTNSYYVYNSYNEYKGEYELLYPKDENGNNINVMNIGYPALNESKYTKYVYSNKVTPMYCKFKMLLSSDKDPYIVNMNYGYSYNQYPNKKYGYFPSFIKGIYPKALIKNSHLKLPYGTSLIDYYKVYLYKGNKTYVDTANIENYIKLMRNYYSYWYDTEYKIPNFESINSIKDFVKNNNWATVKYDYAYNNGILYDLSKLHDENIDKFAVFLMPQITRINEDNDNDPIARASIVFHAETLKSGKLFFNYNENIDMYDSQNFYKKIFDMSLANSIRENMLVNKTMVLDKNNGKYIEELHYDDENTYYKVSDVINLLNHNEQDNINNFVLNEILNEISNKKIIGYVLIDALNNKNFFKEIQNNKYEFVFKNNPFGTKIQMNSTWLKNSLYLSKQNDANKILVDNIYNDIYWDEYTYGKFALFIKDEFIHNEDLIKIVKLTFGINKSFDLIDKYFYQLQGEENGIHIEDYFILNKNKESDIYVDIYNLNNYVNDYKFNNYANIDLNSPIKYFSKILNRKHIYEYYDKLYKGQQEQGNISRYLIFDDIYVKERIWVVSDNKLQIKDRYIKLYDYLFREINKIKDSVLQQNLKLAIEEYIDELKHTFNIENSYDENKWEEQYKNGIYWLLTKLSENRTTSNTFNFNIKIDKANINKNLSVDLVLNKKMIKLNNDLKQIIDSGFFLYLYTPYKYINENKDYWDIITEDDLNIQNTPYIYKSIDECLMPLYNDIYFTKENLQKINDLLNDKKISNNGKYVISDNRYFKEIDVDKTIRNYIINDIINQSNFNFNNWIGHFKDKINKKLNDNYEGDLNNKTFKDTWDEYCYLNNIFIDDYNEADDEKKIELIDIIINYLKTNYYKVYRDIIYYGYGIVLYSISSLLNIDFNRIDNTNYLTYIKDHKIYKLTYNNINYAFYWVYINVDNTINSFNIYRNLNDIYMFDYINDMEIPENNDTNYRFNRYFANIFNILDPFIKYNIFDEFCKKTNTVVFPYEHYIKTEYRSLPLETNTDDITLNNKNESIIKKYRMLKTSKNDVLYNDIYKLNKAERLKLVRYFNYITPYLKKTNIVHSSWELKFMKDNNTTKNLQKFNILTRKDISIYKYNPIKVYNGIYSKDYELYIENIENTNTNNINIEVPSLIYQYEYKHFNDNKLYNLPEQIIITEDKLYNEDEKNELINTDNLFNKKQNILFKYFGKMGYDYENIILFLLNKYDSGISVQRDSVHKINNKDSYKITYKFNLI